MVNMHAVYEGELRCKVTHEPSGAVLATDAPKDNHGKGEAFSPTDLVGAALGNCMLTLMGITARKLGVAMEGTTVRVSKEMVAVPRRRIGALTVEMHVPGAGVSLEQRKQLEHAAMTCPVHESLHPDVVVHVTFHWQGA